MVIYFDGVAFDALFIGAALMLPLPMTWLLMVLLSVTRLQLLMTHVVDAAFIDAALMVPILTMLFLMK